MAAVQGSLSFRQALSPDFPLSPQDGGHNPTLSPFANVDEIYKVASEVIGAIALPLGIACLIACPIGILSWSVGGSVGGGLLALAVITWAVTSSHFREQNEEIESIRQGMARLLAGQTNLEDALPLIRNSFRANIQTDFWTYIFKNELIKPKGPLGFYRLCQAMMDSKKLNMMQVIQWYQKLEEQRIAAGVPGTNYAIPQPADFRRKWREETKHLPLLGIARNGGPIPADIIHGYDLGLLRFYKILDDKEQQVLETLKIKYDQGHDPESLNIQYDAFRSIEFSDLIIPK